MPDLFVIAGPNGAGKSTYSKDFVPSNIPIFDADKELKNLKSESPGTSDALLQNQIIIKFDKFLNDALLNKKSVAYETNLHGYDAFKPILNFKDKGFDTTMLFVGLDNPELCKSRVEIRVANGLHHVDEKIILERYAKSIGNLDKAIQHFDKVYIADNSMKKQDNNLNIFAHFEKGKLLEKTQSIPQWAKDSVKSLAINNEIEKTITPDKEIKNTIQLKRGGMKR